jgi:isopropylmalate/homocitrate/citramalate synthase
MPPPPAPTELSPFNRRSRPDAGAAPAAIDVHDITLREGQQAADVALSLEEQVELGLAIGETGVAYVQAGFAGSDEETVRGLKAAGMRSRITLLAVAFRPGWEEAQHQAVDAETDVLQVLVRGSDAQLTAMGLTRDDALRMADQAVACAVATGAEPWFIASFGTLADEAFLMSLYRTAHQAGATRFMVADTTGIATLETMAYLVRATRDVTQGGRVGVHCHEDFGLANALTLAGIAAGADLAEVSVNGYGERAGNCSLSQLALALELLYDRPTGLDLARLAELERLASRLSQVPIPGSQPVSGENVFAQKLDIHVQLTKENPGLLEPFPPELVGNRRLLRLGRGTGPVAVAAKARELGRPEVPEAQADAVAAQIRAIAVREKRAVTEDEFLVLLAAAQTPPHESTESRIA